MTTQIHGDSNHAGQTGSRKSDELIQQLWWKVDANTSCYDSYIQLIKELKHLPERRDELRKAYEMLLVEYPMCYGYWIRLAMMDHDNFDLLQNCYECGLQFVDSNPQYWLSYIEQCIEADQPLLVTRQIMDRAIQKCGHHWNSYAVWMICIGYDERELKRISEYQIIFQERQKQQLLTITRLRQLYYQLLRTPHSKLSSSWEKFKVVIGQGHSDSNTITLDATDLIVEAELEEFQCFVLQHLLKDDEEDYSVRWKCGKTKADTYEPIGDSSHVMESVIRVVVRYPNNTESRHTAACETTISEILNHCLPCARTDDVDFLFNRKIVNKRATLGELTDERRGRSRIVEFAVLDGAMLASALERGGGRSVEKWFLRLREQTYMETQAQCELRSPFEDQLRRTYFHPFPMSSDQLDVWRRYLDFVDSYGVEAEVAIVYKRCVEACCNYPEFWNRYATSLIEQGMEEAGNGVFKYATRLFVKNNPEMHLMYATYLESKGDRQAAESVLLSLLRSCGWFLEGFIKLIGLYRRSGQRGLCEGLLEELLKEGSWDDKSRACIVTELGYCICNDKNNTNNALQAVASEWAVNHDLSLMKHYMGLLRRDVAANYDSIIATYKETLNMADDKISLVSKWMVWKDYIYFLDHEAPLRDATEAKALFRGFLYKHSDVLAGCRRLRVCQQTCKPQPMKKMKCDTDNGEPWKRCLLSDGLTVQSR